MTVGELISELKKYDPAMEVLGYNCLAEEDNKINTVEAATWNGKRILAGDSGHYYDRGESDLLEDFRGVRMNVVFLSNYLRPVLKRQVEKRR